MSIKKILLAIGMLAVLCTLRLRGRRCGKGAYLRRYVDQGDGGRGPEYSVETIWFSSNRYNHNDCKKKWTNTNIRCGGRSQLRMNMETVIPENSTELSSTTHRLMKSQCPPARLKL